GKEDEAALIRLNGGELPDRLVEGPAIALVEEGRHLRLPLPQGIDPAVQVDDRQYAPGPVVLLAQRRVPARFKAEGECRRGEGEGRGGGYAPQSRLLPPTHVRGRGHATNKTNQPGGSFGFERRPQVRGRIGSLPRVRPVSSIRE